MRGILDSVVYGAAAPVRLFGRSPRFRLALGAVAVVAIFFWAALWTLDRFMPAENAAQKAVAAAPKLPPLPPISKASHVIAPIAVALSAIGRTLDAAAPRELAGKNDNPVSGLLSKADIGITVSRGAMAVTGRSNEMTITVPLTGTLRVTGQIATQAGNLTGGITGLLGNSLGKEVGKLTTQVLDQRADLRGQAVVRSRPGLTANWRLEPNLASQIVLNDSSVSIAGIKLNVATEAKPLIDRAVNEQMAALQTRLRNDSTIERTARVQWAKMCRSIPLGGGNTGVPPLWLEMRPVRAAAAQPQIDGSNLTLTVGIQAETRIVPAPSQPNCPFPAQLELVPPMSNGRLLVGLPIDLPFSALNTLLEAQLKGRTFPDDPNSPGQVEVRSASLAASGDKLLIALHVKARERKSWFGFGAEADVQILGTPVLDDKTQMLRLTDLSLTLESQAAFGLLGAAARAAVPYLQKALADKAQIDLKPFAADAKAKIGTALADFTKDAEGVKIAATVDDIRLTGIAFDSDTLRVIAEAAGSTKVAVSELPRM
jgi:hypothetical protein